MSAHRLQVLHYSPVTDCPNRISLLGMTKTENHSNFKILSVFDINVWLVLMTSLVMLSIINTKFNKNSNSFIIILTSLINHLECLFSKSGKLLRHEFL